MPMTYLHAIAQAAADADSGTARALYLISQIRGRMDALEAAVASRDVRARLRVLVEIGHLFDERQTIEYRRAA
jgi:hypothetical protein